MYMFEMKLDRFKEENVLVVKEDGKPVVKFSGDENTIVKLAAVFVAAKKLKIELLQEQEQEEVKPAGQDKKNAVPVYKRPKKDVSTEVKNAVLNVVRKQYGDGKLFHIKDVMDALPDVSYSVAQAALGHLAHEGWLEKVRRGRKVYYRYTGRKKLQKVLE